MSAEYVMAGGNENVILCERGIRTFESYTRNTLDLACIPVLRKLTHLPIIIDPSHATGKSWLVDPHGHGRRGHRCRRIADRGPQRPGPCPVRWPPVLKPEVFDGLAKKLLKLHDFMKTVEE